MGLRSDHAVGRSYGRKGQTPVILATGQRFACNMISAISNQGCLNFMVWCGTLPGFGAALPPEILDRAGFWGTLGPSSGNWLQPRQTWSGMITLKKRPRHGRQKEDSGEED
jgi:hypothetical protein